VDLDLFMLHFLGLEIKIFFLYNRHNYHEKYSV